MLNPGMQLPTKKVIASYVETQKTMKFLNPGSNILLLEPLPTVKVLRHER